MDYLSTPLKTGQEVRVYRNLTRDCWSVQARITGKGWRVVRHAVEVVLEGATFQVNEKGRQWVLAHHRKTVHAYVYGRFVRTGDGSNAVPEGEINRYVVPVAYRPQYAGHFYEAPYLDRPLSFLAGVWFVNGGRVWGRREYEPRWDGAQPVFCDDCGRHIPEPEVFWFTDWKCPSEIYCGGCGGEHGFPHAQIDPYL
jgi:hypothetical protein